MRIGPEHWNCEPFWVLHFQKTYRKHYETLQCFYSLLTLSQPPSVELLVPDIQPTLILTALSNTVTQKLFLNKQSNPHHNSYISKGEKPALIVSSHTSLSVVSLPWVLWGRKIMPLWGRWPEVLYSWVHSFSSPASGTSHCQAQSRGLKGSLCTQAWDCL